MFYKTIYIGVNYNTPDKTLEWIKSINQTNPESLIVVVDNSTSKDPDFKSIVEKQALYFATPENLGYFNGAAYGFHQIEKDYTFDWIAVTNVDISLQTKSVDTILDKYNNCGVVAPGIISYDSGYDKNPYRLHRPSKKAVIMKMIAFSNPFFSTIYSFFSRLRNKRLMNKKNFITKYEDGTNIYLPYGAALYFSKKYFSSNCKIDFPLFLFGEELYVAEQARMNKLSIVYVPSIKYINYEHASTSKLSNYSICKRNYDAMKFILKEYY